MRTLDKKGATSPLLVLLVICGVVIAGAAVYAIFFNQPQVQVGDENIQAGGGNIIVGDSGCEIAPTLTVNTVDAMVPGTAVAEEAVTVRRNGQLYGVITEGTTKFAKGDKLDVLINKTSFIANVAAEGLTLNCGENILNAKLYDYDAATVKMFNENGDVLTDAATGDGTNQTSISNGAASTTKIQLKGTSQSSTGKQWLIVEASVTANVSWMELDGSRGVDVGTVLTGYTDTLTGPFKRAFEIAPIEGTQTKDYTLTIQAATGKKVMGAVYTTFYSAQDILDVDGTFKKNVLQDADGNTKHQTSYDYDFMIAQA